MDALKRGSSGRSSPRWCSTGVPILPTADRALVRQRRSFAPTAYARLMQKADPHGLPDARGVPYRPPPDRRGLLRRDVRPWSSRGATGTSTPRALDRGTIFTTTSTRGPPGWKPAKDVVIASRYGDSSPFWGACPARGVRSGIRPVPGTSFRGGRAALGTSTKDPFPTSASSSAGAKSPAL